jgi:hypothetical protein
MGGVAPSSGLFTPQSLYLYRRDNTMLDLEGYGLTLQQASKAIELGIFSLGRVAPTKHLVHTTEGKVIRGMGNQKVDAVRCSSSRNVRTNVHIPAVLCTACWNNSVEMMRYSGGTS